MIVSCAVEISAYHGICDLETFVFILLLIVLERSERINQIK